MSNLPTEIVSDALKFLPCAAVIRVALASRRLHAIVARAFDVMRRSGRAPRHWLRYLCLSAGHQVTTVSVVGGSSATTDMFDTAAAARQLNPLLGICVRIYELRLDGLGSEQDLRHWTEVIRRHSHAFEDLRYLTVKLSGEAVLSDAATDVLAAVSAVARPECVRLTFHGAFSGEMLRNSFLRSCPNAWIDIRAQLTDTNVEEVAAFLYDNVGPVFETSDLCRFVHICTGQAILVERLLATLLEEFRNSRTRAECHLYIKLPSHPGIAQQSARILNPHTSEELQIDVTVDAVGASIRVRRKRFPVILFPDLLVQQYS